MKKHYERIFTLNEPEAPRINPALACEVGLNESIVLLQIEYWISISDNWQDGRKWTYQSVRDMKKKSFSFWSIATINRAVNSLIDKGYLIEGNYNKMKYDKTRWFALNFEKLNELNSISIKGHETGVFQNDTRSNQNDTRLNQNDTTIPEITTETTTEITSLKGYKGGDLSPRSVFSFDILDKQIEKIMNSISNNGVIGNLDTNDIKEFFRMYYNYGGHMRNIKPTKLKNEQIENIITSIAYIDKADYNPSLDDYKKILIDYFNQDFPNCDYGINHFVGGDILLMRYYDLRPLLE